MSQVSEKRVNDALNRIKLRRKDGWLQHMLSEVQKVDESLDDLHSTDDNFRKMEKVFSELDKLNDNDKLGDNKKVYQDVYAMFKGSYNEHMSILSNHAKEQLQNLDKDDI